MKPKILVVGDVMLDRYIHGVVERISPEAPIPILRQTHIEDRPGGAANVAMNLSSLGAEVSLVGIAGNDEELAILDERLEAAGVSADDISMPNEPVHACTTLKTRYVALGQQMLRIDREGTRPGVDDLSDISAVVSQALVSSAPPAAIVLSDYAGGVLDRAPHLIDMARVQKVPVFVDPKGTDWERYRGATLIKPNLHELQAVIGASDRHELIGRATELLRMLKIEAMLVTQGADGMTLIRPDGGAGWMHQLAASGPVVDVTGAGDTVLAVVAYLRSLNTPPMGWPSVLSIAARAAAAVCARPGTAVVTRNDIGAPPESMYRDMADAAKANIRTLQSATAAG